MPWIPVLMCSTCPELVPFERGDQRHDVEHVAKKLGWAEHRSYWYCPTCLRAVRTLVGPRALVREPP